VLLLLLDVSSIAGLVWQWALGSMYKVSELCEATFDLRTIRGVIWLLRRNFIMCFQSRFYLFETCCSELGTGVLR
jgi:hypothetical protein